MPSHAAKVLFVATSLAAVCVQGAALPALAERATTATTGVLYPVYYNPLDDGSCYPELTAAYAANPKVPFTLILNPNSGYESETASPMIACIPTIRKNLPLAKLIGYVPTGYGSLTRSRFVSSQVTQWAALKTHKVGRTPIGIDGIFFDEVAADAGNYTLYSTYMSSVKSAFGSTGFITLNPGLPVYYPSYYTVPDLIVTYEGPYSSFSTTGLTTAPITRGVIQSKEAIIIHSIPPQSESTTTGTILSAIVPSVGAVYLTDLNLASGQDVYGAAGAGFSDFVNQLGKKEGGGGRTPVPVGAQ